MIIIEGPNKELKLNLLHEIARQLRPVLGDQLRIEISGTPGFSSTAAVVRLLNTPNQTELRDGLPINFPFTHPIHHMAAYALAATGSIIIYAVHELQQGGGLLLDEYLWSIEVAEGPIQIQVKEILTYWRQIQRDVAKTYRFGGTGFMDPSDTMVVGERINPFRPLHDIPNFFDPVPLAFTSNQGCSFFLHGALFESGLRFYLTNAVKTLNKKVNRQLLAQELAIMRPRRIIAMGNEAAAALAEQRVDFVQTYHPQYWKRFKNKDVGELIELLRSASITTQNIKS